MRDRSDMTEEQLRELKAKYDYVIKGIGIAQTYLTILNDIVKDLSGELGYAREEVAKELDGRLPVDPFYVTN